MFILFSNILVMVQMVGSLEVIYLIDYFSRVFHVLLLSLKQVEKAFPAEAVKSYHEQVIPAKERRPVHHINHINQPQ